MMKKIKLNDFLFLFAVISVFLLLIWKSHIGIANIDETFHLSVPYRMTQGDWLIVDEWHVSQMWSFLLYPLMKIYRMIVQDTEGIVLAFRQMFVVFQLTIMSISYLVLRKRYNFLAVVIPILYGMFVPFNIINFNYNSLGYAITYLLVIFNLEKSDKNYKYIMNGILLAGLVLCNPYTVFIYMIWLIWMLARWDKKSLLWTHMGIFFIAVLFLGLTLSKASFADLLNNLPNILSDAAHEPKTFYNFLEPFIGFIEDYWWYIGMFVITTIMAFRDKKRSKWWLLWLGLFSLMVVWFFSLRSAMRGGIGMNVIMLPLTLFGFVLFVFLENKNWHLFRVALVFPVLYTLCMNMSSNLGMFVIGSGCAVSSIMTMVFFEQWLDENDIGHKYAVEILVFVVIAQLGAEANVKVRHAFWEDNVADLKCEIEVGPMRGLKTTAKKKASGKSARRCTISSSAPVSRNI